MMMPSLKRTMFILSCLMLTSALIVTTVIAQQDAYEQVIAEADAVMRQSQFRAAFTESTLRDSQFVKLAEDPYFLSFFGNALGREAARELMVKVQEEKRYGLSALYDGSGFVRIPAGEFLMGSRSGNGDEQPVHRVRISQSFELGKFEVTQAQWAAVMSSNRDAHAGQGKKRIAEGDAVAESDPSHFKGSTLPVENVSWDEVQQLLRALNARDSKHLYRLPTEAEWEYACRAGSTGDNPKNLNAVAWYRDNSRGKTQPVGQTEPNAWGLYDMHGNVWEWVGDWYEPGYYTNGLATDPQGPRSGSYRVYRGGSWHSSATDCQPAFRSFDLPVNRSYSLGLRLVRTAK